jgi:NAD(P)-dependent dehydrogenase (short-subunit alcohol dehydrogenase family)
MGHVILTSHLLPLMKKTAEAGNTVHIVNLASNAHQVSLPKVTDFNGYEIDSVTILRVLLVILSSRALTSSTATSDRM